MHSNAGLRRVHDASEQSADVPQVIPRVHFRGRLIRAAYRPAKRRGKIGIRRGIGGVSIGEGLGTQSGYEPFVDEPAKFNHAVVDMVRPLVAQ